MAWFRATSRRHLHSGGRGRARCHCQRLAVVKEDRGQALRNFGIGRVQTGSHPTLCSANSEIPKCLTPDCLTVRGRHQEAMGKLGTARLRQERVDFAFGDRSIRMIGLLLNRPQFAGASDDVDSCIGSPPLRPVLPQPDFVELAPILGRVLQEPLTQPFKVAAERHPF